MSGSTIKTCVCKSQKPGDAAEYQAARYGHNQRVMNLSQDGKTATCTVCGKEHKKD